MSSTSFAATNSFLATIDLALRPSLRMHRVLFFLHLVPLALSVFALQPGVPMMLFAAAMGLSWLWLRRHPAFGFGRQALVRLIWQADGHWTVFDNAGRKFEAELLSRSCVHAQLMASAAPASCSVMNWARTPCAACARAWQWSPAPPESRHGSEPSLVNPLLVDPAARISGALLLSWHPTCFRNAALPSGHSVPDGASA